ncbi:longitudinals lacking protein, isoforms H/M/V-like isoform X1 [Macrobrachium nipponense]|uniref:longitudinals lacking protein, isoforms H/M/V-like isoform X1 n=1 Tax=Macrobrachium nipponense TaxID=159736 RepID=UPI0030C86052
MGDGLLMLSWKNHSSTFSHLISSLREKDQYTDVTLACDGKFYPAHKIVLSACSQYFEDMLQNTPCKHPIIVLKDISASELDALLNYMYVGEVSVSQNHLTALIKAAESLHIKGLAVPDELPACHSKESRVLSHPSADERASPPAKRQRYEKHVSPPRDSRTPQSDTPISSPHLESERRCSSYEDDTRAYLERESRIPPLESEKSHLESTPHLGVKTETHSVPSSPVLPGNKTGEHSSSQGIIQDSHISPGANESRSHSNQSYQSQEGFEPLFEVKEEYIENNADRRAQGVSFSPPAVAVASPPLSAAPPASTASGTTAMSPTSMNTNPRPTIDGSNFEDHIRTLLYNPHERREILHTEAGFHGPGPSGLLGNVGLNVREGFGTGVESFNAKTSDVYSAQVPVVLSHVQVGGSRAHPTREACSFPQGKGSDGGNDKNKTSESQDPRTLYHCPYCRYSSQFHALYVEHLATHTGEKMFSCTYCSYRSFRKSVVTKHMKTHHDF